jgi:hypothetical protein
MIARLLLTLLLGIGSALASPSAESATPETLIASGELAAALVIDTDGPLYQRAPFVLAVEIATPRWFSRGSRVNSFRIPGAVLRPMSNFATNQSQTINGQTWSMQRWRFRVFPQEPGLLRIPELKVFVSVNTEDDGNVEGELTLSHSPLEIESPPGTEGLTDWVATPELRVEERWEGLRDAYRPGDAITRTRRFLIDDAPAMMLTGSPALDIPGLSLYESPAQVEDRSNRGALSGVREETLVITFTASGDYELPGLDYAWFNTRSGEVERSVLPPTTLSVAGGPVAESPEESAANRPQWALMSALLAVLLGSVVWQLRRHSMVSRVTGWGRAQRLQRRQRRAFMAAIVRGDSVQCLTLLHWQMTHSGPQRRLHDALPGEAQQAALRALLAHGYGGGPAPQCRNEIRKLWAEVASPRTKNAESCALQLNPRPALR